MLLAGEHPVSQSCRENGKVGSMEGLCSCFVSIDWSHGPSTGTITDGHRARYGIVVCSLVIALEHKWKLETGPTVCSPHISSGEDVFSYLIQSWGSPEDTLTPLLLSVRQGREKLSPLASLSPSPPLSSSLAWFGMRPLTSSGPLGEMRWTVASSPRIR